MEWTEGKTAKSAATRARILLAAQKAFSARGYNDVGLRDIAAAADSDTTLIRRYFGPKERLFEAALSRTLDVTPLLNGPRDEFGGRAVSFFTRDRKTEVRPMAMLIFATADPLARDIALDLLQRQVVEPIVAWLGRPDNPELAARISMLCGGYFMFRRVLPLPASSDTESAATDQWLAKRLQQLVDGKD